MTVATTLQALAARLALVDPSPQPRPVKVYADPKAAVALSEFPCITLALAPQVQHVWGIEAMGLGRHDYTVGIYVFVGALTTPLPELHSRVLSWPEALFTTLVADIRLSAQVDQLGNGLGTGIFTYQVGPIDWADSQLFGLKVLLPVIEKPEKVMG